jgi:cobalt/nickel transport system permease protein
MTHQWHDAYRHERTPAHHLDPRSKIFAGLIFIAAVLLTRQWGTLQLYGYPALLLAALGSGGLPVMSVIKRTFSILPFAVLMLLSAVVSHMSQERLLQALIKAFLSMTAMAMVSMTTPFPDLLRALEQCRTPRMFVMFLAFLYRYAAVLGKEIVRVERGWKSRTFGRFWWQRWSQLGHVLAALLIRSYERAERVYAAMLGRGFSRQMPPMQLLHFGLGDLAFVVVCTALIVFVRIGKL